MIGSMLGRKKQAPNPQPNYGSANRVRPPEPEAVMRVLHAFMAEPVPNPGAGVPNPGGPPPNAAPLPPPPVAGLPSNAAPLPPPPVAGPGAGSSFTFNISTFSGSETRLPQPPRAVPVPGFGAVDPNQMKSALATAMQIITELGGNQELDAWTPEQAQTVGQNLEGMHAQGRLTEEQYASLKAALATMTPIG
jgi:hypothetical protein